MRVQDVLASAVRNSFRNKLRTTLTVVAIFIGAFTLTITSAIGAGVSDYINTQVTAIGTPGIFTISKPNIQKVVLFTFWPLILNHLFTKMFKS